MTQSSDENYLTTAEAARRLNVKPETIYAYVSRGHLTSVRARGRRGSLFAASEVERLARERFYAREVFFVRNLGYVEPTAARRISFEDSLKFERVHEEVFRSFGYELVDVAPAALPDRAAAVLKRIDGGAGPEG